MDWNWRCALTTQTLVSCASFIGPLLLSTAAKAWAVRAQQQRVRPQRRHDVQRLLEDFLERFEAVALADAHQRVMWRNDGEAKSSGRSDAAAQRRSVLEHVDVPLVVQHLRTAWNVGVDHDLMLRVVHIVMHVASLRSVVSPQEFAAGYSAPTAEILFPHLASAWQRKIAEELPRLFSPRSFRIAAADIGDGETRMRIEEAFARECTPVLHAAMKRIHAGVLLALAKRVWDGVLGPVRRHPARHRTVRRRILSVVALTAVLEFAAFGGLFFRLFASYGALASVSRFLGVRSTAPRAAVEEVHDTSSSSSSSSSSSVLLDMVHGRLAFLWTESVIHLIKMLGAPSVERLCAALRNDLCTEFVYELSVAAAGVNESVASTPRVDGLLLPQSIRRLSSQCADLVVRTTVRPLGKIVGGGGILLVGQLWLGDRGLPLLGLGTHLTLECGTALWERVTGWRGDDESLGQQEWDNQQAGSAAAVDPPHVGLRVMCEVLMSLPRCPHRATSECSGGAAFEGAPYLSIVCFSTMTSFGDVSPIPLLDERWEVLQRCSKQVFPAIVASAKSLACQSLLLASMTEDLLYSQCRIQMYLESKGANHGNVTASALRHLDTEEPELLRKGASYIKVSPDYYQLFHPRRFVTLRTLGLDAVFACRTVAENLMQRQSRISQGVLATIGEYDLFGTFQYEIRNCFQVLLIQTFVWMLMSGAHLPRWVVPPIAAANVAAGRQESGFKAEDEIARELFTRITFFQSFLDPRVWRQEVLGTSPNNLQRVVELLALVERLPVLAAGQRSGCAETLCEQLDESRPRHDERLAVKVRSVIEAHRPELQFNDQHLICGGFRLEHGVQFHGVTFAYPGSGAKKALATVRFRAAAGEFTAVIGKTGSGKSTLVHLLKRNFTVADRPGDLSPLALEPQEQHHDARHPQCGIVDEVWKEEINGKLSALGNDRCVIIPGLETRGQITFDGIPIQCFDIHYYRSLVACVPQAPVVIPSFTFAQNIALFRPLTKTQVVRAAKLAQLDEFISALPQGYDEACGSHLSGGEKQRIEIARALAANPALLILDEATAKLDAITEKKIQTTFETLSSGDNGCTMIVIAHRMSTLKCANRYVVLHEGQVAEDGTHEELMAGAGRRADVALPETMHYRAQLKLQDLTDAASSSRTRGVVAAPSWEEQRKIASRTNDPKGINVELIRHVASLLERHDGELLTTEKVQAFLESAVSAQPLS